MTNFCRWITFKAVAYGPANFIVCFISQVDFRFLSADFIMILKDQSMFSASADEISLTTLLFDNLFVIMESEILEYLRNYILIACSLKKRYSQLRYKIQIFQQNVLPENVG